MYLLYLDESGGVEKPESGHSATPVMVILGIIIDAQAIPSITRDFLDLKRRNFPASFVRGPALDHMLVEIKGSHLLHWTRSDSRNRRRHARIVRGEILELLRRFECRIVGRVWVKAPGQSLKPQATYGYAVQDVVRHFSAYLGSRRDAGIVVADSRSYNQNIQVAHSIFTQKWRSGEDPFPNMVEIPVFAHSDNHAGIQIADMVASSVVLPMAAARYGAPGSGLHSSAHYADVRDQHGSALRRLQFRYRDVEGRWRGGLVVSDAARNRPSSLLFGAGAQADHEAGSTSQESVRPGR